MARVKDQLRNLEVRPSRSRGQNFLIDPQVIENIVSFAAPRAEDRSVEIGSGLGALTAVLIKKTALSVIEIEQRFCNDLKERFPALEIINQDVREVDFSRFGTDLVVYGNLPYSLSTPILFHLVEQRQFIARTILMLQREFVDRLAAQPGGREYGALSVNVQAWGAVKKGMIIPGNAFHPRTAVESRLVEITFFKEDKFGIRDPLWFRKVVQAAFSQRRKKLLNSLKGSGFFQTLDLNAALLEIQIDPGRRAETLSVAEFVKLAARLKQA